MMNTAFYNYPSCTPPPELLLLFVSNPSLSQKDAGPCFIESGVDPGP
jgi:hypothetical protein